MPTYYFCLSDDEPITDDRGTELPDLSAAREHAKQVVRELTFHRGSFLGRNWNRWTMSVRDGDGHELWSFRVTNLQDEEHR